MLVIGKDIGIWHMGTREPTNMREGRRREHSSADKHIRHVSSRLLLHYRKPVQNYL